MITEARFYADAGEDMAEAVMNGESETIREIFRYMVETVAMETEKGDKDKGRDIFFMAFEERMNEGAE